MKKKINYNEKFLCRKIEFWATAQVYCKARQLGWALGIGRWARGRVAGAGARRASGCPAGRTGARRWADWALGTGARGLRGRGRQRARHWQAGRVPGRAWGAGWAS